MDCYEIIWQEDEEGNLTLSDYCREKAAEMVKEEEYHFISTNR